MNAMLKQVLAWAESWPEEDQAELIEAAREIEARRGGVYRLTDDERAAVEQGLADANAGRFATDQEIAEILKKARSTRA
jgi:predicted transcriptional regulator